MDVSAETLVIGGALIIFGLAYDRAVTELEKRPGGHEGFTSLLVVAGVAVTVLMLWPLLGSKAVATLAFGFAASGAPMIVGSVARYMRARAAAMEEQQRVLAELMANDD